MKKTADEIKWVFNGLWVLFNKKNGLWVLKKTGFFSPADKLTIFAELVNKYS